MVEEDAGDATLAVDPEDLFHYSGGLFLTLWPHWFPPPFRPTPSPTLILILTTHPGSHSRRGAASGLHFLGAHLWGGVRLLRQLEGIQAKRMPTPRQSEPDPRPQIMQNNSISFTTLGQVNHRMAFETPLEGKPQFRPTEATPHRGVAMSSISDRAPFFLL